MVDHEWFASSVAKATAMLVRRLAGALCILAVIALGATRVSSDTGDKQLARVKGVVGYQTSATSEFKAIFGQIDLPDDSFAVTRANAEGVLRLRDSSEIELGENTKVQVGAFNPAESGTANTIALNNGALHFTIRHPAGGQSNYKFVTATSQIAVRGTEGYLVAGSNGTQVVCVSCAAGDVSVQVGQQTVTILSNQTLTILGTNPLNATTTITANPAVNNPAINQFNANHNPFNPNPTGNAVDPTGSTTGVGGAGSPTTVISTVAAAAAVGAIIVGTSGKGGPAGPGTLVLQFNFPGATTFPYSFSWPFSQQNATGLATFVCSPPSIITCTPNQSLTGGTLNGTLTGMLLGPGSFTVAGSASGYVLPTTTLNVYGGVSLTSPIATPLNFPSVPASQQVTVTQLPLGSPMNAAINCPGGAQAANVTLAGASGVSPLTFTVNAVSAPTSNPPPVNACTITVTGSGDGPLASIVIPVNVTATGIGVSTHVRKPL